MGVRVLPEPTANHDGVVLMHGAKTQPSVTVSGSALCKRGTVEQLPASVTRGAIIRACVV